MNKEIIKILIVDDEKPARAKLRHYVATDNRFTVVGEAKDGQQAIDKISKLHPQLILLDIQMPGMTGFDVLRLMDAGSPAVIFTTAYDEYAVKAFDVSAVDYLLKPINESRLQQALDKVSNLMPQDWDKKVADVLLNLEAKDYIQRLAVRRGQRSKMLNTEDIRLIHSEHRLINIYNHQGERHWTNEKLSQLENRLNPQSFMRIHRSSIVNLAAKFEIETWDSGRLRLHFSESQVVVVSRENAARLKKTLQFK